MNKYLIVSESFVANKDPNSVVEGVASLYKIEASKLAGIATSPTVLSRNISIDEAKKLKTRLFSLGLVVKVFEEGSKEFHAFIAKQKQMKLIDAIKSKGIPYAENPLGNKIVKYNCLSMATMLVVPFLMAMFVVALAIIAYLYTTEWVQMVPGYDSGSIVISTIVVAIPTTILLSILGFLCLPILSTPISDDRIIFRESEQPVLFSMIENFAEGIGVKPPREIYLDDSISAYVTHDSLKGLLKGEYSLTLGFSLFKTLTANELAVVICHELSHMQQRSRSFSCTVQHQFKNWLYKRSHNTYLLEKSLKSLYSRFPNLIVSAVFGAGLAGIALSKRINQQYLKLIDLSDCYVSKFMEYHSDAYASDIMGSDRVIGTLRKIDALEEHRQLMIANCRVLALQFHAVCEDYFELEASTFQFDSNVPVSMESSNKWDTHPSTIERIEKAALYNRQPKWSINCSAESLLNKQRLTTKINQLFFDDHFSKFELEFYNPVSVETWRANFNELKHRHELVERIFGSVFEVKPVKLPELLNIKSNDQNLHVPEKLVNRYLKLIKAYNNNPQLLGSIIYNLKCEENDIDSMVELPNQDDITIQALTNRIASEKVEFDHHRIALGRIELQIMSNLAGLLQSMEPKLRSQVMVQWRLIESINGFESALLELREDRQVLDLFRRHSTEDQHNMAHSIEKVINHSRKIIERIHEKSMSIQVGPVRLSAILNDFRIEQTSSPAEVGFKITLLLYMVDYQLLQCFSNIAQSVVEHQAVDIKEGEAA